MLSPELQTFNKTPVDQVMENLSDERVINLIVLINTLQIWSTKYG